MESAITIITAAVMSIGLAALSGYLLEKWTGAALFGFLATVASALCLVGALLGYNLGGKTGGWVGLLLGVVVAGVWWGLMLTRLTQTGRSGRLAAGLWFGLCGLYIFSYLAGGLIGLLTITAPAVIFFWIELYRLSGHLLPLRDKRNRVERRQAFRSLLTFTMGTNYPYYFVDEESRPAKWVDGNPFRRFLGGPGFVITGCDHAAYITDGVFVKGVSEPGLTFTEKYDLEPRIIDLRPQLRGFPVEALTKDGIPIKVVTFVPYRIDPGNQAIELGQPFPFRSSAAYQALASEVVERKADKKDHESGKKHRWDGGPHDGLVPLLATPIVQDVISRYNVDELCAAFEPNQDPRVEIAAEIRNRVKETLRPRGLEVIGGGIGNLIPQDESIIKRRIDTWRTKWVGQILIQLSESQAYRLNQIELARFRSEIEAIKRFGQIIRSSVRNDLNRTLILGLIDSLSDVVSDRDSQRRLPNKELEETLKRLRGEI